VDNGSGTLGAHAATTLRHLGFRVAGWSRSAKTIAGIQCFHGEHGFDAFLRQTDILVCLLPLTPDTRGVLNARTLGLLPRGAFLVNGAKSWLTVQFPEYWLFFLGAIFIAVTLFLPQGVVGAFKKLRRKDKTAPTAAAAEVSA